VCTLCIVAHLSIIPYTNDFSDFTLCTREAAKQAKGTVFGSACLCVCLCKNWKLRIRNTPCLKKRHWCCTLQLQSASTNFGNFWQRCCWESMPPTGHFYPTYSNWCLCTTWGNMNPKIVSFQSRSIPCLDNNTAFAAWCQLCLFLRCSLWRHQSTCWTIATVHQAMQGSTTSLLDACCVVGQHDWKDTISGVHVSPGSAETLVRRGGTTNRHMIACSLSNVSAKSYEDRLMCDEVITCNISVVFLRHSVGIIW